jgi:hypothetical protein
MFDCPPAIRKEAYTTNTIELVQSAMRKFTLNRKQDPDEESGLNLVYLTTREASKKSTMLVWNWRKPLNRFAVMLENGVPARARSPQTSFPSPPTQKALRTHPSGKMVPSLRPATLCGYRG